jgi:hypothetical protein
MSKTRRAFIKESAITASGIYLAGMGLSAKSYANIIGAKDRISVVAVGISDRFRQ